MVHIFKNRNGYQKGSALVEFESEEDRCKALKTKVKYLYTQLAWAQEDVNITSMARKQEPKMGIAHIQQAQSKEIQKEVPVLHEKLNKKDLLIEILNRLTCLEESDRSNNLARPNF